VFKFIGRDSKRGAPSLIYSRAAHDLFEQRVM
jgi:hypothetical protein